MALSILSVRYPLLLAVSGVICPSSTKFFLNSKFQIGVFIQENLGLNAVFESESKNCRIIFLLSKLFHPLRPLYNSNYLVYTCISIFSGTTPNSNSETSRHAGNPHAFAHAEVLDGVLVGRFRPGMLNDVEFEDALGDLPSALVHQDFAPFEPDSVEVLVTESPVDVDFLPLELTSGLMQSPASIPRWPVVCGVSRFRPFAPADRSPPAAAPAAPE